MADPKTTGLGCSVLLDVNPDGRPVYCGVERGTKRDPRQERYDVGLCPKHWREVFPDGGGDSDSEPAEDYEPHDCPDCGREVVGEYSACPFCGGDEVGGDS